MLSAADEELGLEGEDSEVLLAARDGDELDIEEPNVLLAAPECALELEGDGPKVLLAAADCELDGEEPNLLLVALDCDVELEGRAFEADIDVLLAAASGKLDELAGEIGFEETAAEYGLLEGAAREENVDDCAAR